MNINRTQNQGAAGVEPSIATSISRPGASEKSAGVQEVPQESVIDPQKAVRNSYNVALSSEAKDIKDARARAFEIAMKTPEVREDKVRAFKEQIKNGVYKADAGAIADGMLREAIKDKLATSE